MFEKELAFFIAHQDELVRKYKGRVLVLRNEHVEGDYTTPLEAYTSAKKKFGDGGFMIQPCQAGPEAYTVTIASLNW